MGEFGRAVRAEVLSELGRAGLNAFSLSKRIDRSANYLNKRITNDEKELSLSDIEMICESLGIEITPLMERAERALIESERSNRGVVRPVEYQSDYAPAAESDDQFDLDEGDMIP